MTGRNFPQRMARGLSILLLSVLTACATRNGNLSGAPEADDRLMAADTAKRW